MFRMRVLLLLIFIYSASLLHGQGNSEAAHVRALNNSLLTLHGQLQAADASQGNSLHSQASAVIAERFAALQTLIGQDPTEAIQLAFDEDVLAALADSFPQSASQLEAHGVWQAPVEYVIFDDPTLTKHRVDIRMQVAQETLDIHFPEQEPGWLKCGDILHVEGIKVGTQVAAAGGNVTGQVAGAGCSTTGAQNIAVILVNFPNATLPSNATVSEVTNIFFGTGNRSVNGYWTEASYGKASAAGTVVGPYLLSQDYTCDQYDAMRAAAIAAADGAVNFTQFTRIMVVFPNPPTGCAWAGLGMLGCSTYSSNDGSFTASTSWLLATYVSLANNWGVELATHEGGHNLTLHHASSRYFTNATTGLAEPLGPLNTQGTLSEYGSTSNTMGSWNLGQYDAPHKAMIGWLAGSDIQTVQSNGSFSLNPVENNAGLRALKVQRGTGNSAWLWLEYRQGIGQYDSTLPAGARNGAMIHYEDAYSNTHTHLLDFTTSTPNNFSDPALFGAWTDPYTNLSLNVTSATSSALGLSVSYGPVPCVAGNPTVSISPSNPSAQAQAPINYTVTVTNNDTSGCVASDFTFDSAMPNTPSLWTTSAMTPLNLAPGQSGSRPMTKTSPAGTTPGTYGVNGTASHPGGASTGSANATIIVKPVTFVVATGTFKARSTVTMTATVTSGGNAAGGASVLFTMTKANGAVTTKTVTAGSNGVAVWNYKLSPKDPNGAYTVKARATYVGLIGDDSNTAGFTITP